MKKILILALVILLMPLAAHATTERVFDNAGIFSEDDITSLKAAIMDFQKNTRYDFVILTTDDFLGVENQQAIAESFYDSQGFGLDGVHSGLLFYIDMNQRIQYICTTGNLISLLDDVFIDEALDVSTSYLRKGEYKEGMLEVIRYIQFLDDSKWESVFPTTRPSE